MIDDSSKSLLRRSKTIPKAINCVQQFIPAVRKRSSALFPKTFTKFSCKSSAKILSRPKSSCTKLAYSTERKALVFKRTSTHNALLPYLKALILKANNLHEQPPLSSAMVIKKRNMQSSKSSKMLYKTQYKNFAKIKPLTNKVHKLSERIHFARRSKVLNSKLMIISFEGVIGDYFSVSFWKPEAYSLHLRKEAFTSLQRLAAKYQLVLWFNSHTKAKKFLQYIKRNVPIDAAYVLLPEVSNTTQVNYEQVYEDFQVGDNVEYKVLVIAAYQSELLKDSNKPLLIHKLYNNQILSRHIPLMIVGSKYRSVPIVILVKDLRMCKNEISFTRIEEVVNKLGTTFEDNSNKHIIFIETDEIFLKLKERIETMRKLYKRRVNNNRKRILDKKSVNKLKRVNSALQPKYIELLKVNQRMKGKEYPISYTAKFYVDNGDMDLTITNTTHKLIMLDDTEHSA